MAFNREEILDRLPDMGRLLIAVAEGSVADIPSVEFLESGNLHEAMAGLIGDLLSDGVDRETLALSIASVGSLAMIRLAIEPTLADFVRDP